MKPDYCPDGVKELESSSVPDCVAFEHLRTEAVDTAVLQPTTAAL